MNKVFLDSTIYSMSSKVYLLCVGAGHVDRSLV
jgi:uncharacterized protein YbaP (TraB family)